MDRELKKRRWAVRKRLEGWKTKRIYESLQIPRRTFYNWWEKYKRDGWKGLEAKSRKPLHPRKKLNESMIERILEIRKATNFGPNKIEIELRMEGITIGHTTIYKVLRKYGMNNSWYKPEANMRENKYWRSEINKMWQEPMKIARE